MSAEYVMIRATLVLDSAILLPMEADAARTIALMTASGVVPVLCGMISRSVEEESAGVGRRGVIESDTVVEKLITQSRL